MFPNCGQGKQYQFKGTGAAPLTLAVPQLSSLLCGRVPELFTSYCHSLNATGRDGGTGRQKELWNPNPWLKNSCQITVLSALPSFPELTLAWCDDSSCEYFTAWRKKTLCGITRKLCSSSWWGHWNGTTGWVEKSVLQKTHILNSWGKWLLCSLSSKLTELCATPTEISKPTTAEWHR